MKQCGFCNLTPTRNKVIYDGKTVFVIPSNPRLVVGHLLVIPKRHIEKPSELTAEERTEIFDTVLKYQEKILAKVDQGCDIQENYRPFVEQSETKVDHIHFHLIPRDLNDNIMETYEQFKRGVWQMISKEEVGKTAEIFKD